MALIVVRLKEEKIEYYDPKCSDGGPVLRNVFLYLKKAHVYQKKRELDMSKYKRLEITNIGKQSSDNDCGVFIMKVRGCCLHSTQEIDT